MFIESLIASTGEERHSVEMIQLETWSHRNCHNSRPSKSLAAQIKYAPRILLFMTAKHFPLGLLQT